MKTIEEIKNIKKIPFLSLLFGISLTILLVPAVLQTFRYIEVQHKVELFYNGTAFECTKGYSFTDRFNVSQKLGYSVENEDNDWDILFAKNTSLLFHPYDCTVLSLKKTD